MRLSIWCVVFMLMTGCAGRARKPAMVAGGALAIAGTALVVSGATNDCGDGGALGDLCRGTSDANVFGGLWVAAVGTALLIGSALRDGSTIAPTPPRAPDPYSPPPAMEPEPASW